MDGTIKSIILDRGFGFIRMGNSRDAFFHVRELDPALAWDERLLERRVEFDVATKDGKERAVNVRPAKQ